MKSQTWVDTNTVVYFLTGQPQDLAARCRPLFWRAHQQEVTLYIHPLLFAEATYVLEETYQLDRSEIAEKLLSLSVQRGVVIDQLQWVQRALVEYRDRNIDFVDAFLGCLAATGIRYVATFNVNHLKRIPGCKALPPDQIP